MPDELQELLRALKARGLAPESAIAEVMHATGAQLAASLAPQGRHIAFAIVFDADSGNIAVVTDAKRLTFTMAQTILDAAAKTMRAEDFATDVNSN